MSDHAHGHDELAPEADDAPGTPFIVMIIVLVVMIVIIGIALAGMTTSWISKQESSQNSNVDSRLIELRERDAQQLSSYGHDEESNTFSIPVDSAIEALLAQPAALGAHPSTPPAEAETVTVPGLPTAESLMAPSNP